MREAAVRMLGLGPEYVVIKGGHLEGSRAIDLLAWEGGELLLEGARYPYEVHGTGCCFAAAVTAYIARGETVPIACRKAKEFVSVAVRCAVRSRSGIRMANPGCRTEY
jgi:hydroxymethylpyrimidine/phosphomethylpyrimidine kinase